jgi:hypothetical protein
VVLDLLEPEGFGYYMRTVLSERSGPLGFACLLRDRDSTAFTDREVAFMRRIAPHLARGLRMSALIDSAVSDEPPAEGTEGRPGGGGPAVMVLDARGRVVLRAESALQLLTDLADVGTDPDGVPYAVAGAAA